MATRRGRSWPLAWATAVLGLALPATGATNVAVFNFQLKTDTPQWVWLEKFLADQITTDFARSEAISVVARDEMQLLAQKVRWAPEMATTDPARMAQIRRQLKIEYLISGVCSVRDGRLEIIAQIVHVQTRRALYRKAIADEAERVLVLQKRLSADLLSWLTKRPVAQILPELPVWTRSIPAARALYEGMDLYDQGRYAEAWLKFRQSSRQDLAYVEARYWAGKMYYFMDRYEHARRAFEHFVYLDANHPRMGDAIREYLHTYEKLDAPAETLLRLYADFKKRWPRVQVHDRFVIRRSSTAERWLNERAARLLEGLGRYKEAAEVCAPAINRAHGTNARCLRNVLNHYKLTGEILGPEVLMETLEHFASREFFLNFADGATEKVSRPSARPVRILGGRLRNLDESAPFCSSSVSQQMCLVAPSGHTFRAIRFYPVAEGDDGVMEVRLDKAEPDPRAGGSVRSEAIARARRAGVVFDELPPAGIYRAKCTIRFQDAPGSRPMLVTGFRVVPEFEKLGPHGAVDVVCPDTPYFRVEVDGRPARTYPGLIGPLRAGKHPLTLLPMQPTSPYRQWETTVTVAAGKVTPVAGRLRPQPSSPWSLWGSGMLIGDQYPGQQLERDPRSPVSIQMDNGAIRVVWCHQEDVWSSVSTDGKTFSAPRRLPLPVSSGWAEAGAQCIRDESGRFVLTFLSDRNGQHRQLPYVCWSRDFVHWSAPALMLDRGVSRYDFMQDRQGRFIFLCLGVVAGRRVIEVYTSTDAFQWGMHGRAAVPAEAGVAGFRLLQREDGAYELFVAAYAGDFRNRFYSVLRYSGNDLKRWARGELITRFRGMGTEVFPVCDDGRLLLALRMGPRSPQAAAGGAAILFQDERGNWRQSPIFAGVHPWSCLAHRPRWGYWMAQTLSVPAGQSWGPYLARAESLEPLLAGSAPAARDETAKAATPPPRRPVRARVGELTYFSDKFDKALSSRWLEISGPGKFDKAKAGSGTVHPDAAVVTLECGPIASKLAIDSSKPELVYPDLVRWDISGTGNFHDAHDIPLRQRAKVGQPGGLPAEFTYRFQRFGVMAPIGGQPVPVDFECAYRKAGTARSLTVRVQICAEGACDFGGREHRVRLYDGTSNLLLTDVARPLTDAGRVTGIGPGDTVMVDLGGGGFKHTLKGFYGQPVLVDGRLYDVRISADGMKLLAQAFAGPAGRMKVGHPQWRGRLVGLRHVLWVSGGPEPMPVPADRYVLTHYREYSSADAKTPRAMLFVGPYDLPAGRGAAFAVPAGKTVDIAVGSPIHARLSARRAGGEVQFELSQLDAAGTPIDYVTLADRRQPAAPVVEIMNAAGNLAGKVTLSRASGPGWTGAWSIPAGARGRFTGVLRYPIRGFEVKADSAGFTIP